MFLFKKILSTMLLPLTFAVEVMVIGLILLWFTKKQQAGKFFVTIGIVLLIFFSFRTVPYVLLKPLESKYEPIAVNSNDVSDVPLDVKWVIVLGGGHNPNRNIPITSRISAISLTRLAEGIRIYKMIPRSRLIVSGGGSGGEETDATTMGQIAEGFGVNASDIVLDTNSLDTEQQAMFVRSVAGKDKTLLVTSAWHMPRAMGLFRKAGIDPVPAPTDYLLRSGPVTPRNFYPTAEALEQTKTAMYEYMGIAWAKLRGKM